MLHAPISNTLAQSLSKEMLHPSFFNRPAAGHRCHVRQQLKEGDYISVTANPTTSLFEENQGWWRILIEGGIVHNITDLQRAVPHLKWVNTWILYYHEQHANLEWKRLHIRKILVKSWLILTMLAKQMHMLYKGRLASRLVLFYIWHIKHVQRDQETENKNSTSNWYT